MHDANQHFVLDACCGGDSIGCRRRGTKHGVAHAQGVENIFLGKCIECFPRNNFNDLSE